MAIVKAAPKPGASGIDSKEAVLQYFADAINSNSARGKMQVRTEVVGEFAVSDSNTNVIYLGPKVDRQTVATDGFMCNILGVLLKMSDGFVDSKYSKIHLIDVDYYKYSHRTPITDHTRINSDTTSAEEYFSSWRTSREQLPVANFISDVFYLTLASQHYGFLSAVRNYGSLLKSIEEFNKQLDVMRSQRGSWQGPMARMNEMMFIRYTVSTSIDQVKVSMNRNLNLYYGNFLATIGWSGGNKAEFRCWPSKSRSPSIINEIL